MNLRHVNPLFLQELQLQLSERGVDLGDVEIREWQEFPYEGIQVLVFGSRGAPTWLVDTSGVPVFILGGRQGSTKAAAEIAEGIAAYLKEGA